MTFQELRQAIAGHAAAIRCRTRLQPAGGPGTKVFPPTHTGGVYATEKRRLPVYDDSGKQVDTREAECVLLDSVQSQANRIEDALQQAIDDGLIEMPLIVVDFSKVEGIADIQRVTSLQAPHRAADAILRDSINGEIGDNGTRLPFRSSPVGKAITDSSLANATGLFQYCPHALFLGVWDSTGPKGGLGAKFARALVSEIVGIDAVRGVRTSSRIDPVQIPKNAGPLYRAVDGSWTVDPDKAKQRVEKGKPMGQACLYKQVKNKDVWHEPGPLFETDDGKWTYHAKKAKRMKVEDGIVTVQLFGKQETVQIEERLIETNLLSTQVPDAGKPSTANHGNVTPDLVRYQDSIDALGVKKNDIAAGGCTISHAEHTAVLSLPQLRRLRFPLNGSLNPDRQKQAEIDNAARAVLASLALVGLTLSLERGSDLRSRCLLVLEDPITFELLDMRDGQPEVRTFSLNSQKTVEMYRQAVKEASKIGLPWETEPITLTPSPELVALVKKSQALAAAEGDGEEV